MNDAQKIKALREFARGLEIVGKTDKTAYGEAYAAVAEILLDLTKDDNAEK